MWEPVARHLLAGALFFLPYRRRKAMERWLRGRGEHRKLQQADWVLVSWGKSGRTWLRVMVSRVYQLAFGLSDNRLLSFDNLHRLNARVPRVLFTHGNYLRDYTGHGYDTKADYHGKRVVLLVRDPRDVAVSQFFQWKFRMQRHKKRLNDYPPHGSEVSIFDFVMDDKVGVPQIIRYFNGWLRGIPDLSDVLMVRYEDMRRDPGVVLAEVLDFTGTPPSPEHVADAVEFAAYDNMKKMEENQSFSSWRYGWRMKPGDKDNPDSFKVRRGKVGGYRDYFSDAQLETLDAMVDRDLLPQIGYTSQETGRAQTTS